MEKQTLAKALTYSGTLPFIACAIYGIEHDTFIGLDIERMILVYGAVIASFIAGTHWGIYLFKDATQNLFLHSNIAALLAWTAPATLIPGSPGILFIVLFYLLFIDKQLSNAGVIEDWYMTLRTRGTIIVMLALTAYALL